MRYGLPAVGPVSARWPGKTSKIEPVPEASTVASTRTGAMAACGASVSPAGASVCAGGWKSISWFQLRTEIQWSDSTTASLEAGPQ